MPVPEGPRSASLEAADPRSRRWDPPGRFSTLALLARKGAPRCWLTNATRPDATHGVRGADGAAPALRAPGVRRSDVPSGRCGWCAAPVTGGGLWGVSKLISALGGPAQSDHKVLRRCCIMLYCLVESLGSCCCWSFFLLVRFTTPFQHCLISEASDGRRALRPTHPHGRPGGSSALKGRLKGNRRISSSAMVNRGWGKDP